MVHSALGEMEQQHHHTLRSWTRRDPLIRNALEVIWVLPRSRGHFQEA